MVNQFDEIIRKLRRSFRSHKTEEKQFRLKQLKKVLQFLNENENLIIEAINKDLRKPSFEIKLNELELIRNECLDMIYNLDEYMSPEYVSKNLVLIADNAMLRPEPYGLILIIGTWNYPLLTLIQPLVGAIAAGNVCIAKTSEVAANTAELIAKLLPQYIDNSCYHVFNGGPEICQELLKQKFDYVFFTGSNQIGKLIHSSAAKDLTPVTLELGGKSPVYIDEKIVNLKFTCRRLLWGKLVNAGQTCVAPDYILCTALMRNKLINTIPEIIKEFYNNDLKHSKHFGRIINRKHFDRLRCLLETTKGKIIYGGNVDADDLFISLTIVIDLPNDDSLMKQEIFGPIFPIITVADENEAIEFINNRPTPLSLYVFSERQQLIEKFISQTSSGSLCANDVVIHYAADTLPFGGVGESGFGCYHGRYTFNTFSHKKSVLIRGFNPIIEWVSSKRYPPYKNGHFVRLARLIRKRKIYIGTNGLMNLFVFLSGAFFLYIIQLIFNQYHINF